MQREDTIKFIKDTYNLIKKDLGITMNDFTELLGIDRRMFVVATKPDYDRSLTVIRMLRRLCHLLRATQLRPHVLEWLIEIKNKETYEDWHGKTYTQQIRREEPQGHKSRKAKVS
jgi:hypothetical protein